MNHVKSTLCILILTLGISSSALAGNIGGMRTDSAGNIGGLRTNSSGNIGGLRTNSTGNIAGLRTNSTGNIAGLRTNSGFMFSDELYRTLLQFILGTTGMF